MPPRKRSRLADRGYELQKRALWLARNRSPALQTEPVLAATLDEIAQINAQLSFQDDKIAAEGTRRTSKTANNTAAGHLAADIAYYTALIVAGRKAGVHVNARQTLINLGGGPPSPGWQATD